MKATGKRAKSYLVLGCKSWHRRLFDENLRRLPGRWHFIGDRESFSVDAVRAILPRYIFFLHWSWKVPDDISSLYECVCFHMTDVPFGRGGSPLQNLIARGLRQTKLTALRMTGEIDAGPVYVKEPLSLKGGAEEIYLRAGGLSARMIEHIVRFEPNPVPQKGEVVTFKRRKPEQSEIKHHSSLQELHDLIRMLDAEGYPPAFFEKAGFRFEFSRPALYEGRIVADVTITPARKRESSK